MVPPVNIEIYNKTPLQGIQALTLDSDLPAVLCDHLSAFFGTETNMINFHEALKVFQKEMGAFRSNRFLKPVYNKAYMAAVTEIRIRQNKRNEVFTICKLDGLIETAEPPVKGETHWVFFEKNRFGPVSAGDRICFKLERIGDLYEREKTRNLYVTDLFNLSS